MFGYRRTEIQHDGSDIKVSVSYGVSDHDLYSLDFSGRIGVGRRFVHPWFSDHQFKGKRNESCDDGRCALRYSKGAWISNQMAAYIANLGYAAAANHSRHYDLLLVPAAIFL
jgi:hypothetical protein